MDEDFYDTYLENMECIEPEKQYTFNDRNDIFKVDTSTISIVSFRAWKIQLFGLNTAEIVIKPHMVHGYFFGYCCPI